jgi:hypothetical protein
MTPVGAFFASHPLTGRHGLKAVRSWVEAFADTIDLLALRDDQEYHVS